MAAAANEKGPPNESIPIVIVPRFEPAPFPTTALLGEALYYHAARRGLAAARRKSKALNEAVKRFRRLERGMEDIKSTRDSSDAGEAIAIQMEDAEYQVGKAYAPVLRSLATVHVFAALCLEAYINGRGAEHLESSALVEFDKLSLVGKYQFLPALVGSTMLRAGEQPLQAVSRIARLRNALVHYKRIKEMRTGLGVPERIAKLGLNLREARRTVRECELTVRSVAGLLRDSEPDRWVHPREGPPFGFWLER